MPTFAPSYLASWTGGQWTAKPEMLLGGFTQDTRQLHSGQVFVALKTEKRDGHDFLAIAKEAGASAALVSRPVPEVALPQLVVADTLKAFQVIGREYRRAFRSPVVGVSGSCGKTSTKNLLARLLGGESRVLATEGNLNNFLGVPLTLTRLEPGTHEAAVIEAGISEPGEMGTLAEMIEPDYGVITLVAPAHTEELGGIEGVAREKAVLLQHVRPGGLSVFPRQCWDFLAFQDLPQPSIVAVPEGERIQAPTTVSFSTKDSPGGTEIFLGRRRFALPRVSRGMAQNAALAIILASELGTSDDAIQQALTSWQPAKWRGEFRRDGERWLYLDFYNANPASMADSLDAFRAMTSPDQPRMLVLGCMEELGQESPRYHRELGRGLGLRPQDEIFVIGSHAEDVAVGAVEGGASPKQIQIVDTLEPVRARLAEFRGAVFIKGSRRYELEKALPAGLAEAKKTHPSPGGGAAGAGGFFSASRDSISPLGWALPRAAARSARTHSTPFIRD
jgi:UDP-N-acetylmuramoyl-tripeptide--D-alanyl-D-alanine ligase